MENSHILIVEDDPRYIKLYSDALETHRYTLDVERELSAGLQAVQKNVPDLVLLDLSFDGTPEGGLTFISAALENQADLPIIIISAHSDSTIINKALDLGAVDYIVKDHSLHELLPIRVHHTLKRTLFEKRRKTQIELHKGFIFGPGKIIIGQSPKMLEVYALIEKVARSRSTALILGESGTGKELVAEAIHDRKESAAPYISIDCGAVPESVLESELFGVKARYPGFHNTEPLIGKMEVVGEGTLLLDEIGNMGIGLQAKLLRVLEERRFSPLGSEKIQLLAQIIASTNIDFKLAIESKRFREDLYYRLNDVPILLPPLRERKEDIPLVVSYILDQYRFQTDRTVEVLPQTLEKLIEYDWPGNVRELVKTVHRALIGTQSQYLTPKHIELSGSGATRSRAESGAADEPEKPSPPIVGNYKKMVQEYQKKLLRLALDRTKGNQSEAAKLLGLHRTHFIRLINFHGLNKMEEM